MDGVGSRIKLPSMTLSKIVADVRIRRKSTTVTKVLWDFRTGVGFGYLQQQTNGVDVAGRGTVKIDGVTKTNSTAFIPENTRVVIEHDFGITGTDDGDIFINNALSTGAYIDGDIFDIKIYNGTTLVAWYDMTTGTVNDQSGNGRNATLTGGTWLDDGIGGTPTGTDGSTAFDSKQIIYQDSSFGVDTKQVIYSDESIPYDSKQIIYQDSLTPFDMLQELYADGESGSTPFDMRIVIFSDESTVFDTTQFYFESGMFYVDLELSFYEGDPPVIETIYLKGSRDLIEYLKGSRDLYVSLKGGRDVTEKNQNFTMYSGDSKNFEISLDFNTAATIEWVFKKSATANESILRKTADVINGKATIRLLASETTPLFGTYYHVAKDLTEDTTLFTGLAKFVK